MDILLQDDPITDFCIAEFSTEVSLTALHKQGADMGLNVSPVYTLSDKKRDAFNRACRDVLLQLTPKDSHILGLDGKEYFRGDGHVLD